MRSGETGRGVRERERGREIAVYMSCFFSRELMALCLKKLKSGLSGVRLVDASFVWTEPHSKRIRVKLIVQGEVAEGAGAVMQQTVNVEFVVAAQMCDECRRVEAKDTWNASVQVRQKSGQRKTLYYLEQMIIKYQAAKECSSIKLVHGNSFREYPELSHLSVDVAFLDNGLLQYSGHRLNRHY